MLGHVVRCKTSREIWNTLETVFQSQSKSQIARYRVQLQTTKKGALSVEDYLLSEYNHKGYRCLEPTGKIYIADTVKFNPTEFPYPSLFPSPDIASSTSPLLLILPLFCPPPLSQTVSSLQGSGYTSPHPLPSSPPSSISQPSAPTPNSPISSSQQSTSSPTLLPSSSTSPLISSSSHTLSHSSPPSSPIPPSRPLTDNTHPMITRSKNNIFKPKVLTVTVLPTEPKKYAAALSDPRWYGAMKDEFQALLDNKTWSLVPYDPSMKVISNKWVFRVKTFVDGSLDKLKARLVARGFEQFAGIDFLETFSPVVKSCTMRLVFTLAATRGWSVQQIDISNVFLNGVLEDTIHMSQPHGFVDADYPTYVCKLHKSLYGLKQAPRAWYIMLKNCLLELGFQRSTSDFSLFHGCVNGNLLLILVYVDDILLT